MFNSITPPFQGLHAPTGHVPLGWIHYWYISQLVSPSSRPLTLRGTASGRAGHRPADGRAHLEKTSKSQRFSKEVRLDWAT